MQIAPDQGAWMSMMVSLVGARRILEVGTFTGYSALAMASSLPDDGELITMDVDPETTAIARAAFEEAGVAHKISSVLGPAEATLRRLLEERAPESFDLAFIDADKENLRTYYELSLALIRRNGLILVDNVLWNGRVIDDDTDDSSTSAIRAFNAAVRDDPRVEAVMLHCADGIYMLRKR
jgi:caffeoyl-CoA O-methyltransferase